ncbi:MAG: RNA-directed DNA polymerase [Bryobacterales bacterium]|nr:RNA-directed DNA polymerase [Bryobacterales bacterium]
MLAPKARHGFRVITQIDPLDLLVFTALIREICKDVEKSRIPKSSNVIFSYRVRPQRDGQLFDPKTGYRAFRDHSRQILRRYNEVSHIVLTDISDFYSRIYHHRLENALQSSTKKSNHVKAIMHILSGWNVSESFGIPIGNTASRLLAELTISDIDSALLAADIRFVRFNDDYRIFCQSYTEAYKRLSFLADYLRTNHGLTLQAQKTRILKRDEFERLLSITPATHELRSMSEKFDELIESIGLNDPYGEIDYEGLDEANREIVDSMNLRSLLDEQIDSNKEIDIPLTRFLLRRLAQIGDSSAIDSLLENLNICHPVFPDIIKYIGHFSSCGKRFRVSTGKKLLSVYDDSIVGELEYHKLWCLHLFSVSKSWHQRDRLFQLYAGSRDTLSRRELILAMGQAKHRHWFQSQWRDLANFSPWPRRAVLAGASCMPRDARNHWYRSLSSQLDVLEDAVVKWVRKYPFGGSR